MQTFNHNGLTLKVLGSSSSGNAYIFEEWLAIEAGLPLKEYTTEELNNIEALWISHTHGDHIAHAAALYKWKLERGFEIAVHGNEEVADALAEHGIVVDTSECFIYSVNGRNYSCATPVLYHSVMNNGLRIYDYDMQTLNKYSEKRPLLDFFTDTKIAPVKPEQEPHIIVGESNHFRYLLDREREAAKQTGVWFNAHSYYHLSAEAFDDYCMAVAGCDTLIIEAHQSGHNRPQNRGLTIGIDKIAARWIGEDYGKL